MLADEAKVAKLNIYVCLTELFKFARVITQCPSTKHTPEINATCHYFYDCLDKYHHIVFKPFFLAQLGTVRFLSFPLCVVDTDFCVNALAFACEDTVLGKSKLLQLYVVGVCVTFA